jgi:hypothetical protein
MTEKPLVEGPQTLSSLTDILLRCARQSRVAAATLTPTETLSTPSCAGVAVQQRTARDGHFSSA